MPDNFAVKDILRVLGDAVVGRHREHDAARISETLPAGDIRIKLAVDAVNYFLSKIVPGLMGFVSVVVFVRLVGYEQYGRYAVVFAIVMALTSGLGGWLAQGILRFHSQMTQSSETLSFFHSSAVGTILSIFVGAIVLTLVAVLSGVQTGWPLLISVFLFSVLLTYTVTLANFQASLRSRQVLRFEMARSIGSFIFPVLLVLLLRSKTYSLLLLGIALGYSVPLLAPFIAHVKQGTKKMTRISAREYEMLLQLWHFGWPVALWFICQQGLLVSDRFFLQKFVGYSDAGVYSSMYDVVVRSFSLLFMPVTLAVHPLVMNRWNAGNAKSAFAAIRSGVKYQVFMFLPIAIFFGIFAHWICRFVLGKAIPGASSIVLPLAISGFLWQLCLLAHKPLEILCLTKRMLAGMMVSLAINIGGNWLFIPRYGYFAASCISVVSSATYLLLLFVMTPMREFRRAATKDTIAAISADSTADNCLTAS